MSSTLIRWNIEEMRDYLAKLKKEVENLQGQRSFLANINSTVEEAWRGAAGTSFDTKMDIDIEVFDKIIEQLSLLNDDLESVLNKCYMVCEDSVKSEVQSLLNKIS